MLPQLPLCDPNIWAKLSDMVHGMTNDCMKHTTSDIVEQLSSSVELRYFTFGQLFLSMVANNDPTSWRLCGWFWAMIEPNTTWPISMWIGAQFSLTNIYKCGRKQYSDTISWRQDEWIWAMFNNVQLTYVLQFYPMTRLISVPCELGKWRWMARYDSL